MLAVDNLRTGHLTNLADAALCKGFRFEEGDITKPGLLNRLVKSFEAEAIVHLAGLVSVTESLSNPELNYLLNVGATHLVGEAGRNSKVRRMVFASSAAVYGHGSGGFAVRVIAKVAAESVRLGQVGVGSAGFQRGTGGREYGALSSVF